MSNVIKNSNCPWCQSTKLEPRESGDTLKRLFTCLECGAVTRSHITVTTKALLGLCRMNKKITAIKLHRHSSGVDLKEAKDFVDNLQNYM